MRLWIVRELKRRNVLRMAVAYGVASWLLLQVADVLVGLFGLPDWSLQLVGFLLLLGFLPAMVFSWVFELTPDGIKRETEVEPTESITASTGQRLNVLIIAGLSLAVIVLLVDRFVDDVPQPGSAESGASSPFATFNPRSIAVLPFDDFSPESDQGWFADGLTEELLNALTRVPDLMVASRTGSFRFRGTQLPLGTIAEELRVAHILEGSVRRAGDSIRVTAQLIRAADDRHLWSDNFDGTVDNVIAIQEDMALAITAALEVAIDPEALREMVDTGTRSVEAYEWFLRGQELGDELVAVDEFEDYARRSRQALQRAVEIDPSFARAHYALALAWLAELDTGALNSSGSGDPQAILDRFVDSIDAAVERAPSDLDRTLYRGVAALGQLRLTEAKQLLSQYLDSGRNDFGARFHLVEVATRLSEYALAAEQVELIEAQFGAVSDQSLVSELYYRVGRPADGARVARSVVERDPTSAGGLYHAHRALLWDGQVSEAREIYDRYAAIDELSRLDALPAVRQACAEGRRADALRIYEEVRGDGATDVAHAMDLWHIESLLMTPAEAAANLAQALGETTNVFGLSGMMLYPHFEPMPFPRLQQLITRERIQRPPAAPPPFACPQPSA